MYVIPQSRVSALRCCFRSQSYLSLSKDFLFRKRPAPAFGPELHHMGKDAARLQQLCGRALLGYRAVPERHDLVCAGDGAHPVGDDEDGFVFD